MVTTNQTLILDALKKKIKMLILNMTLKIVIKLQRKSTKEESTKKTK